MGFKTEKKQKNKKTRDLPPPASERPRRWCDSRSSSLPYPLPSSSSSYPPNPFTRTHTHRRICRLCCPPLPKSEPVASSAGGGRRGDRPGAKDEPLMLQLWFPSTPTPPTQSGETLWNAGTGQIPFRRTRAFFFVMFLPGGRKKGFKGILY